MADPDQGPSALLLLKWPLLALVLGVLASGLFVAGSIFVLRQAEADEKVSQRTLRDAQARIGNANKEIQDLIASVDTYKRMRDRGMFSEPSRLLWIERIAALKERHQLVELEYELGPRTNAPLPSGESFPSIEVLGSPVSMTIRSLHDGDLVGFLAELPVSGVGAFPMSRCLIKSLPATPNVALAPRIESQCNLLWVTLVDKRPPDSLAPRPVAAATVPMKAP
ncbi:MAG: hypothetical protein SF172_01960 [Burkholderiales bacterium]|nr:hypothetical protein [Burkholderiales bacterium]